MSGQSDDTDKSFDATPQKLLEARKKGEIAKSTDLFTAASYAGLLVALLTFGTDAVIGPGGAFAVVIDQATGLAPLLFEGSAAPAVAGLMWPILIGIMPLFLVPAIAVILAIAAQKALVFAPSKLAPKLSRISLLSNAKNKFGRSGLFEFFKSFTKLVLYSGVLALFISMRMPDMVASLQTEPQRVLILLAELCIAFLCVVVLISGLIGGVDVVWQHFEHLRKNKMSHKEIMDENKTNEGDPHLKQERRQRAVAAAQNQMMADVPGADVIIVNPTHYAVALKWSRDKGTAPICVAKGVDEIARTIREKGQSAGVPIHSDPPTARSLYATTEIGSEIAPEFYRAVAAAIRFAESMRQKANQRI